MWAFRVELSLKALPQVSQTKGLESEWILECEIRESLCLKRSPHSPHWNGRSPECWSMWLSRWILALKALSQCWHWKFLIFLCIELMWDCNLLCFVKFFPQSSHLICKPIPCVRKWYLNEYLSKYFFSQMKQISSWPLCVFSCIWKADLLWNFSGQKSHWNVFSPVLSSLSHPSLSISAMLESLCRWRRKCLLKSFHSKI